MCAWPVSIDAWSARDSFASGAPIRNCTIGWANADSWALVSLGAYISAGLRNVEDFGVAVMSWTSGLDGLEHACTFVLRVALAVGLVREGWPANDLAVG